MELGPQASPNIRSRPRAESSHPPQGHRGTSKGTKAFPPPRNGLRSGPRGGYLPGVLASGKATDAEKQKGCPLPWSVLSELQGPRCD